MPFQPALWFRFPLLSSGLALERERRTRSAVAENFHSSKPQQVATAKSHAFPICSIVYLDFIYLISSLI
jgi:hypothetical protein